MQSSTLLALLLSSQPEQVPGTEQFVEAFTQRLSELSSQTDPLLTEKCESLLRSWFPKKPMRFQIRDLETWYTTSGKVAACVVYPYLPGVAQLWRKY